MSRISNEELRRLVDAAEGGAWQYMADPEGNAHANAALIALAPQLAAEVLQLREALTDLVSWFDGGPSSYGPWIIKAGEWGADAALAAARATLYPASVVDAVKQGDA